MSVLNITKVEVQNIRNNNINVNEIMQEIINLFNDGCRFKENNTYISKIQQSTDFNDIFSRDCFFTHLSQLIKKAIELDGIIDLDIKNKIIETNRLGHFTIINCNEFANPNSQIRKLFELQKRYLSKSKMYVLNYNSEHIFNNSDEIASVFANYLRDKNKVTKYYVGNKSFLIFIDTPTFLSLNLKF